MPDFRHQHLFEHPNSNEPEYRLLTSDHVRLESAGGRETLHIDPEALRLIARDAMDDIAHLLRASHLEQLRRVFDDPEASGNDRFVALELLKNANIAAGRVLPGCQDTGTAIVLGYKGQDVYTDCDDEEVLCVTEPSATVELDPVAAPRGGTVMAVVPLTSNQVLVVESRRRLGFDAVQPYTDSVGSRVTPPGLPVEGVLVYTVDASLGAGDLPLKVAGDSGDGTVGDFPLLEAGDSVTVRGYTVSVTADSGRTHTVSITKAS